jgi:hypothetical protein
VIPALAPAPGSRTGAGSRRRRFGLDAPLPADRTVIARAVLRHLAEARPAVVVVPIGPDPGAGAPDLLLLAPGRKIAFVRFKTQAETLPRAHRAFADLCRGCGVPLVVVRSLAEARAAFDRLKL